MYSKKNIKTSGKEYVKWKYFEFWPDFDYDLFTILPKTIFLQLFTEFIQTQKRYLLSIENKSFLTWRLLIIPSQFFFVN